MHVLILRGTGDMEKCTQFIKCQVGKEEAEKIKEHTKRIRSTRAERKSLLYDE
jgi:hypothetical protein